MAEGSPKARILLVEDEVMIALAEIHLLEGDGYKIEHELKGEAAVQRALEFRFDLVLMDINLGKGIDGGEAAKRIRGNRGPPVVFLSSHFEDTAVSKTRDSGGYGYIFKGSGDKILLASIRMALGLAAALRGLAESEDRWKSLASTAPDLIFSIGPDRRILFVNKIVEGKFQSGNLGADILDNVLPDDRDSFARKIEVVFSQGASVSHHLRSMDPEGMVRRYDAYLGPVHEGGLVVSATAVIRDVTVENRLAMGEPLDEAQNAVEVKAAMSAFDFAPVRGLLSSFCAFNDVQVSIVTIEGEIHTAAPITRVCRDFHRANPVTSALCAESDHRVETLLYKPSEKGYVDYRCANGLRDIALPLAIEGVRWATLFIGQFLYDDDEIDEAELADRAKRLGWDSEDYLAAIGEVPRFSRAKMAEVMSFFSALGRIVTSLAYGAFKERVFLRRMSATASELSVGAPLVDQPQDLGRQGAVLP